ncbi:hypothetical protein O0L34_g19039 [Tuta absoluta]|nr:hypothetical protein O0L34_g19039 [Tuta absoluta]
MLERLKRLRECCSKVPGEPLFLCCTTWDSIDDLITSLKPAKICTKMLQEEQLTPGDFYYHWNKCYLETSHIMTPLAQQICICMKNRQELFMSNAPFISALYLDPRFKVVLSDAEGALAVAHINATWMHILNLESKTLPVQEEGNESSDNLSTSAGIGVAEVEDEIEDILSRTETKRRSEQRARYI